MEHKTSVDNLETTYSFKRRGINPLPDESNGLKRNKFFLKIPSQDDVVLTINTGDFPFINE